jgi:hypothetical protein
MNDDIPPQPAPAVPTDESRRRDWSSIAAIIAAAVGLLALVVSAYTAYIQRQQVRAQVWPYLILTNNDSDHSLNVFNKGVGPAIMRGAVVRVDDKAQADWDHVLDALGIAKPRHRWISTIHVNVLSPGEHTAILTFPDEDVYKAFRTQAAAHMRMELCYCSTLGECWDYSDSIFANEPQVSMVAQCAEIPAGDAFQD